MATMKFESDPIIGIAYHKAHGTFVSYDQVHIFEDNDTKAMWLIDGLAVKQVRYDMHVPDKHVQELINFCLGHNFVIHERDDVTGYLSHTCNANESQKLLISEAKKSDPSPADCSLVSIYDQLRYYDDRIKAKHRESLLAEIEERER